jgi:hypothetical protein
LAVAPYSLREKQLKCCLVYRWKYRNASDSIQVCILIGNSCLLSIFTITRQTTIIGSVDHLLNVYEPFRSIARQHMEEHVLPRDFKEFLKLLNEADAQYLLIGGYAVGYYGYPRATADLDIWIAISPNNADKMLRAFRQFGMTDPSLTTEILQQPGKIIRMGVPPIRIEVLTEIDGVDFTKIDGVPVTLISRTHLLQNKKASGRYKDLDDIEHLLKAEAENE